MKKTYFPVILLTLLILSAPSYAQSLEALAKAGLLPKSQLDAASFALSQKQTNTATTSQETPQNTKTPIEKPTTIEDAYDYYDMSKIERNFNTRKYAEQVNLEELKEDFLYTPHATQSITVADKTEAPEQLSETLAKQQKDNTQQPGQQPNFLQNKKKTHFTPNKRPLKNKEKASPIEPIFQFGYTFFKNKSINGPSLLNIPVNNDYILGPGDTLGINIWGKIERSIEITIDNSGNAYIPKIGKIPLSGTRFGNVNSVIKSALEKHYININVSTSVTKLKTIKVFILGHVEMPGAYDISSLSTLFMALHMSEGPKKTGSLRNIQLKRNNKTIKTIDLYDYLLKGDSREDITLKANDTIFVPPIGETVMIDGAIKQPGIYEIRSKTSSYDGIVALAGGIEANGYKKLIQIQRIFNNETEEVLDLEFTSSNEAEDKMKRFVLKDGDSINVNTITKTNRNTVTIEGNVHRPKTYQFEEGLTLETLINKAEGLKTDTFTNRIEIFRYVSDKQREILFANINTDTGKNFELKEWDIVVVNTIEETIGKSIVAVDGAVLHPGQYQLLDNMRVSDLTFLSKIDSHATLENAELYRKNINGEDELIILNLEKIAQNPKSKIDLILKNKDKLFIRHNGSSTKLKKITLTGEFKYPGAYYARENEPLSSIIERAGGFTENAFLEGAIFKRTSIKNSESYGHTKVLDEEKKRLIYDQRRMGAITNDNQFVYSGAISFLENKIEDANGRLVIQIQSLQLLKSSRYDITIEDEDTLHVPVPPVSVQIVGGIQHPTSILFEKSKNSKHYIKQAGGYSEFAKKKKVLVFKADGTISKNANHINRGDTIYIPEKIKVTTNWLGIFTELTQIIFNTLTSLKVTGVI